LAASSATGVTASLTYGRAPFAVPAAQAALLERVAAIARPGRQSCSASAPTARELAGGLPLTAVALRVARAQRRLTRKGDPIMRIITAAVFVLAATALCTAPASAGSSPAPQPAAPAAAPAKPPINLNTATVEQLETLPGIGRKTAERIVEHRTRSGSFKRIEELMNVKGIGEKSFLRLKPLIVVTARPEKAPGD
jgi:competence protein ComEA